MRFAQSKGLDDVGLQSAWILWNVVLNVPGNVAPKHVWVPIIDGLHDIVVAFYAALRFTHAATVTRYQLLIVGTAGFGSETHVLEVLEEILGRIELQVPLAIENERAAGDRSGGLPLGQMYSPADAGSLGWDFRRAIAAMYSAEDQASYQAAFRRVLRMQEVLSGHLRRVAENNELGGSLLVREIDGMIKQIGVAIVDLVDEPAPLDEGGEGELISGFIEFLTFYTLAFGEKKRIDGGRLEQCCDSLTVIGLRFFAIEHPVVLRHCIRCMELLKQSACKSAKTGKHLSVGGVLAFLWGIREVAIAQDRAELVHYVDSAMSKPVKLSDEGWELVQEGIRLRRDELIDRLQQRNDTVPENSAYAVLRELLKQGRQFD